MDLIDLQIENLMEPCLIYLNTKIIGWTKTWQEADAICDSNPDLQWGYAKKKHYNTYNDNNKKIVFNKPSGYIFKL